MKLSLPVTTFAALALLLESTDLVHAKRLAEPEPLSATEASPLEPRDLSMVSVYDVPATRDAGTFKEKNKQLPPPGVYGVDPDAEEDSDASNQGQDFETHIVGGTQADLGEYPYFVDMNVVGCGGALIAPQVVMSAAHCGDRGNEYVNQRVIVGAYRDNTSTTTGASSVTVTAQRNHPNYDDNSMENDFMLLRLGTAVNIATPKLSIATSGGASSPAAGTSLTVIGVGATSQGGSGASTLREVVVPVVDVNECNDLYEGGIATDVMFCAGTCRHARIVSNVLNVLNY
jgi:Trypsin